MASRFWLVETKELAEFIERRARPAEVVAWRWHRQGRSTPA
jgi:hypothetical protein